MTFRLEIQHDRSGILFGSENDGKGGYEPGKPLNSTKVTVSRNDIEDFERRLAGFDFWLMPSQNETYGFDGARWIFEGSVNGIYHVVQRQPEGSTPFTEAMMQLMTLSKMDLGEIY